MIADGLWVLLFGMIGIFAVMGIVILTILLMTRLGKGRRKESQSEQEM